MIETAHFLLIPCRACLATSMVLRGRRPPAKCVKCQSPFDEGSASFGGPPPATPARFRSVRPAGFTRTDPTSN